MAPACNNEHIYDLFDAVFSIILLIFSLPIFAVAAILVKIDSPGPVFYLQHRYGKNKNIFTIYKFRTMRVGVEADKPVWGKEDDPRANKIGRFLRVTHIDELPQLFNIFKGEMSLVGPRPERPFFAEKFKTLIKDYDLRFEVKPGLTGLAQINGFRADSSVDERVKRDLSYVLNRSFFLNLKIVLLTPFAKPVKRHSVLRPEFYHERFISQKAEAFLPEIPLETPIANA
jgi:lipopolysaccharide/colanic/teichoic acid biosynthesis glycosyltransferase